MAKFMVTLIETLEKVVEVEAENINEARQIATSNYKNTKEDYILTADNITNFEIGDIDEYLPENTLINIANWLVETGYACTMSGNYHITFEETAKQFNLPTEIIEKNANLIASYIDINEKILSETWIDEDFDMIFCGDFDD